MVVIADGPWSIHNDLMTPTLKIKRGALESRYEQRVEEWRRQDSPVVWESIPGYTNPPYVAARGGGSRRYLRDTGIAP